MSEHDEILDEPEIDELGDDLEPLPDEAPEEAAEEPLPLDLPRTRISYHRLPNGALEATYE